MNENEILLMTQEEYDTLVKKIADLTAELYEKSSVSNYDLGIDAKDTMVADLRNDERSILQTLHYYGECLKKARIISNIKDESIVSIGDTIELNVTYPDDDEPEKSIVTLVGSLPDINKGEISTASPVGKAILGKKIGDTTSCMLPDGLMPIKIIAKLNREEEVSRGR